MTVCEVRALRNDEFLLTRPSRGVTALIAAGKDDITFLLTRPSRGVTLTNPILNCGKKFLLTRPSRGVTYPLSVIWQFAIISTHTPLAGRDLIRSPLK